MQKLKLIKKKFLVFGYVRTGTHRIKEFIRYNIFKKFTYKNSNRYKDPLLIAQDDIFKKKNSFKIFDPYLNKKFKFIKKENLLKKKIISTHHYYKDIAYDFKDYQLILTIRDPISCIASIISYSTKKEIIKLNPQYRITNPYELVKSKKIVKSHISNYINFYKKVLRDFNTKSLENLIIIDYKQNLSRKFNTYKFIIRDTKKSSLHISMRYKKKLRHLLNKNFNMTHANKLYEAVKKLK